MQTFCSILLSCAAAAAHLVSFYEPAALPCPANLLLPWPIAAAVIAYLLRPAVVLAIGAVVLGTHAALHVEPITRTGLGIASLMALSFAWMGRHLDA